MNYYIIIRGPLGCGKSTVAKALTKKIHGEYISVDEVLKENNLVGNNREEGFFTQKSFLKANKIIIPKAKDSIKNGTPVIIDGNFYWKSQIDDLTKNIGSKHFVFTLKAPLDVCIDRDSKRERTHGVETSTAIYNKATEFDSGVTINVNRSLDKSVKEILTYLPD